MTRVRIYLTTPLTTVCLWVARQIEKLASSQKCVGHRYAPRSAGSSAHAAREPMRDSAALLLQAAASCLSNLFTLAGKRYAVRDDSA